MNKTRIFTLTLLLATLAVGCTEKEQVAPLTKNHLWIFANDYTNDSKTTLNPNNPVLSQWVVGENVLLNGTLYDIDTLYGRFSIRTHGTTGENEYDFVEPLDEDMHSLYPGASFDGNEVEIVNGKEIVLHRLVVSFLDDTTQKMAFPMVATSPANSQDLLYNHLTGGIQVKLLNFGAGAVNLASIRIVAQSESELQPLGRGDTIARWAVEGPLVPSGAVGGDDIVDVRYSSVMNFDFKDGSNNYITLGSLGSGDDTLRFCVPVTVSSIKNLILTGFAPDGTEVFHKQRTFPSEITVERNKMYTIPWITID